MSTQFTNRQWRLPNNENKAKQSNYSMDFDGINATGIAINGSLTTLGILDTFSFSLWVNVSNYVQYRTILSNSNFYSGFALYMQNNRWRFHVNNYNTNYIEDTTDIVENQWYHIAVTWNNTSGAKMYVNNGTPITGLAGLTLGNLSTNIEIGGTSNLSQYTPYSQIDGVSIFNYALTDGTGGTVNQIAALYGSSSTGIGNPMSLSPKPVAYYPLGDQDAFNGANYLVPNSSLKDYVFSFDGSNDYIDLGNLQPSTTSLSISAWGYKTDTSNASIIGRGASVDYGIFTYSGSLMFGLNSGSWSTIAISNFTSNYLNQWFHVCATWDGSNMKLYLNGNEEASASKTGTITYTSNDTTIGKNSTLSGFEWDGKISNVQTYTTALSSTDVETLYNNGSPLTSMSGFTSLQGWWKLDASATYDGTDWTIPDDSTNSNTGTSSGMTQANLVQSDLSFTSGYSPYALDFDSASNDKIDCGTISQTNEGDISFSVWCNLTTTGGYFSVLSSTDSASRAGILIIIANNGKIKFERNQNISGTRNNSGYNVDFSFGNWNHLCGTFDSTSGVLKAYVNGVLQNTSNNTTNSAGVSGNLTIGALVDNTGYSANGSISNASIWNTALTSSQVTEIYNEGVPSNLNNHSAYSNLVSWWQLGSNSSFNSSLNQWTCIDEKGTNTGESSQTFNEDAIVDGVGSYANGVSSGMSDNIVGSAPFSDANSLSYNMDVLDRVEDTPPNFDTSSFLYDGVDEYFSGSSVYSSLDGLSSYAISFWVRSSNYSQNLEILNIELGASNKNFNIKISSNRRVNFGVNFDGSYYGYTDTTTLVDNQWFHILATRDNSRAIGDKIRIYINGVNKLTSDSSRYAGALLSATEPLYIGKKYSSSSNLFNGEIDEVAIYDQDMASYVSEIYASGTVVDLNNLATAPNPVSYFRSEQATWNGSWSMQDINSTYTVNSNNMEQADKTTNVP